MKLSMRPFVTFFFMLLIALASVGPRVAEARECESASQRFKGTCVSSRNCASICQTERFSGGHCRGLRRRCFCTNPCA